MYNGVPTSLTGAWISFCLCAPCRAFRFARPCLDMHPGRFSTDTAPAAAVEGAGSPKSPPGHKQQEEKRSNYSLILAATTQQAGMRTLASAKVRR